MMTLNYARCTHGRIVDDRVPIGAQCQLCDWCPRCEAVREYDGETCTGCGRVWGEHP